MTVALEEAPVSNPISPKVSPGPNRSSFCLATAIPQCDREDAVTNYEERLQHSLGFYQCVTCLVGRLLQLRRNRSPLAWHQGREYWHEIEHNLWTCLYKNFRASSNEEIDMIHS